MLLLQGFLPQSKKKYNCTDLHNEQVILQSE